MDKYVKQKSHGTTIIHIFFTFIFIIMIIIIILNKEMFRYWTSNGTGIVADQEYHFTPDLQAEEDYIRQEFTPVERGLVSIDIRLANEHPDDIDCTLLFSIYSAAEPDCLIWQEVVSSEAIVNWRYYSLECQSELKYGQKYILEITCPENLTGIPFKVFICNEVLRENKQLTFNNEPLEGGLDLIYNYHAFRIFHWGGLIFLCLAGIIVSWLKNSLFKRKLWGYTVLLVSAAICLFLTEYLAGNNMADRMTFPAVFMNFCILLGILFLLLAVSNSSFLAGGIMAGLVLMASLINHYTLLFRGTVILPSDIYSVSTAYHVVDNYKIGLDREILNAALVFEWMFLLLYKTHFKQERRARLATGILALAMSSWVTFVSANEKLQLKMNLTVRQDAQTDRSQELGFLLNFAENIRYLYLQKPKGYSDSIVHTIYSRFTATEDSVELLPNIIVIMNESFTDLGYLGDIQTDFDYMQNFYRIAEEPNAKAGKCVVSVYGGGTSCSEFEFLTGCSMMFLPSGNAPYQQYINKDTEALPVYLKRREYSTYAIHAANPRSWNRETAYPKLGFDKFINIEDEAFETATYCRYWVDDKSMFDELMALYRQTENNIFQFGLTIQCHGGYDYKDYNSTVHLENMQADYPDVDQYLSLIRDTDQAFGDFIDTLRDVSKPVIVLMFGDHLPQLSDEFYNELMGDSSIKKAQLQLEKHETPYLFWANYDVDFSEIPDILSANFLSPYLLKAGGIGLDPYYHYLYELSKKYPVISRAGIVNSRGEFCEYLTGDACYKDILEYEMLQYSRLKNGRRE